MSAVASLTLHTTAGHGAGHATREPLRVWLLLILTALGFLTLFLFVPLAAVFVEALKKSCDAYLAAIVEPGPGRRQADADRRRHRLPANLAFGVAAAWVIAKFEFRGKRC